MTLRRITRRHERVLTTRRLGDGSTVYSGTVAAGWSRRESGFKEGRPTGSSRSATWPTTRLRTRPHPLAVAVTVGAEGIVREYRRDLGHQRLSLDVQSRVLEPRRYPGPRRARERETP